MSEKVSRIILSVEAIILCLPLTLLFLVFGTLSIFSAIPGQVGIWKVYLAFAFTYVALYCAWRLMIGFIFGGKEKLNKLPNFYWIISLISAVLVVTSFMITFVIKPTDLALDRFVVFSWGLPFVVPLVHLGIEHYAAPR